MYINIVLILCMIKVRVITLGKLIGLLFLFCPPLYFVFENSKNTRNELARPVMGTIFLVYMYACMYIGMSSIVYGKTIQKNRMLKCVGGIT